MADRSTPSPSPAPPASSAAPCARILEERGFPVGELRLLASARSRGRAARLQRRASSASGARPPTRSPASTSSSSPPAAPSSRQFVPQAVAAGATVIDKSSVFRQDPAVPLVVPEVNADAPRRHTRASSPRPTAPPSRWSSRSSPSTTPPASSASSSAPTRPSPAAARRGIDDARRARPASGPPASRSEPQFYPHQIAFNVLPHIDSFLPSGYTKEEQKMVDETRQDLRRPGPQGHGHLRARAGVRRAQRGGQRPDAGASSRPARRASCSPPSPGIEVVDDPAQLRYPMPLARRGHATRSTSAASARTRPSTTASTSGSSADNLRKGAALNAVQIAEELVRRGSAREPAAGILTRHDPADRTSSCHSETGADVFDVVIVGAGPAGLTAGIYCSPRPPRRRSSSSATWPAARSRSPSSSRTTPASPRASRASSSAEKMKEQADAVRRRAARDHDA